MRSRSRWNSVRATGGFSSKRRPRDSAECAAYGARCTSSAKDVGVMLENWNVLSLTGCSESSLLCCLPGLGLVVFAAATALPRCAAKESRRDVPIFHLARLGGNSPITVPFFIVTAALKTVSTKPERLASNLDRPAVYLLPRAMVYFAAATTTVAVTAAKQASQRSAHW